MAKKFVAAADHTVISAFTDHQRKILRRKLGLMNSRQSEPTPQIPKQKKKGESAGPVTKSYRLKQEEDGLASLQKFLKATSVSGLD
jgi:hypothetical protein